MAMPSGPSSIYGAADMAGRRRSMSHAQWSCFQHMIRVCNTRFTMQKF
jgi:hypothetical protein